MLFLSDQCTQKSEEQEALYKVYTFIYVEF